MISPAGGQLRIECDGCGEVNDTGQKEFQQALNIASVEGWDRRKRQGGNWHNYCPRCADEANPDLELAGIHFFKKSESE